MKIAIAGYGQEGEASYRYWQAKGDDVTIVDESDLPARPTPKDAKLMTGAGAFASLIGFDMVVRTASLRPDKIKTDGKIWSATNEFFSQCPAEIIGVTGTKGKGTTSSLIAEMLKSAGRTVHLLGNIGVPALEILPKIKSDDIVVFELSSFQLWDLEKSPHVAVVLMLEPDHLDVHTDMDEYVEAKSHITSWQTDRDVLVYHPTNQLTAQVVALSNAGQKIRYQTQEGCYVQDKDIVISGKRICSVSEVGLLGEHNLENICAAITAAWQYTQDTEAVKRAVVSFTGLPHRLEFVAEKNGIKYYDDSQATGPTSTIAALRAFKQPVTLILGGSDKGLDSSAVIEELDPGKHTVLLIGALAGTLEERLKQRQFSNYQNLGQNITMKSIVEAAAKTAQPGSVVLLSPAHASFDMFANYQDRGEQFKRAVLELA